MGNLLLITPGFRAIRENLPQANIACLTTDAYGRMLYEHDDLDQLHELSRDMTWKLWKLIAFVRQIRKQRYDLVIDGSEGTSLLGAAFVAVSKAKYRLGFDGSPFAPIFNLRAPTCDPADHRISKLLSLLSYIGIHSEAQAMKLPLSAADRAWAADRWKAWSIPEDTACVGINLGARGSKRWPLRNFDRVIRQLIEAGIQPILFVGPQELDRLNKMESQLPEQVIIDTTHDPCRFAALLGRCSVCLTCDTGPMHLAISVGTPTVALFRINNFNLVGPLGSLHRILYDKDGDQAEEALKAVLELLNLPDSRKQDEAHSLEVFMQV